MYSRTLLSSASASSGVNSGVAAIARVNIRGPALQREDGASGLRRPLVAVIVRLVMLVVVPLVLVPLEAELLAGHGRNLSTVEHLGHGQIDPQVVPDREEEPPDVVELDLHGLALAGGQRDAGGP